MSNRDKTTLEIAAEKCAESHDPPCKWIHCPARLDAIKFFTFGAEFERQRTEKLNASYQKTAPEGAAEQYSVSKQDERHQCPACGEETKWTILADDFRAGAEWARSQPHKLVESLEARIANLEAVVSAARVLLDSARAEKLDENGPVYTWQEWLVYRDNERALIKALAALDAQEEK